MLLVSGAICGTEELRGNASRSTVEPTPSSVVDVLFQASVRTNSAPPAMHLIMPGPDVTASVSADFCSDLDSPDLQNKMTGS